MTCSYGDAASCNLKYRSAPEWTSTECLLNTTVWGKSSQVTWGAKDDLPGLHRAVVDVVRHPNHQHLSTCRSPTYVVPCHHFV